MSGHQDTFPGRQPLLAVRLEVRAAEGQKLTLRAPRFRDHPQWRALRLSDREVIEPFWVTSPQTWPERHTENHWVRECLLVRQAMRRRKVLSLVIEVDGQFAGQCIIGGVDAHARSAELGIWIGSTFAGQGLGSLAAAVAMDYAFDPLAMHRIVAPICVDNIPAIRSARRLHPECEATMSKYFDVGGRPKDHSLWVLTADDSTVGRLTALCKAAPVSDSRIARSSWLGAARRSAVDAPRTRTSLVAVLRLRVGTVKRLGPRSGAAWGPRELSPVRGATVATAGRVAVTLAGPRHLMALRRVRASTRMLTRPLESTTDLVGLRAAVSDLWLGGRLTYVLRSGRAPHALMVLTDLNPSQGTAHLTLVGVSPELDQRDLATGVVMLLTHAFASLGLRRVATLLAPSDESAIALAARVGMHKEGTLREAVVVDGQRRDVELWARVTGEALVDDPQVAAARGLSPSS
jgi:RimJ/RimL family protein N-acetyltransferase